MESTDRKDLMGASWTPSTEPVQASAAAEASEDGSLEAAGAPQPAVAVDREAPRWALIVVSSFIGAVIALAAVAVVLALTNDSEPEAAPVTTTVASVTTAPEVVATPQTEPSTTQAPSPQIPLAASPADVDAVAVGQAVIPSIVSVEVGQETPNGFQTVGSGSGVVIDADNGYIVTNDHVVDSAEAIQVVLSDSRIFEAALVGTDPVTDLAVVQIDATDLTALPYGAADTLVVGEPTVAVGSPLGLEGGPSLTVGVLSATGRLVQTAPDSVLYGMLQTDAPITRGSSGGALVDSAGRLIGITTAIGVSDAGAEGIGFASPVELVDRVVTELIAEGEVNHAFIGITGSTAYEDIADNGSFPAGVLVNSIESGSGAAAGGLEVDDVITSIAGQEVTTMEQLIAMVRRSTVGEVAEFEVLRNDEPLVITIEYGPRP